MNKKNLSVEQTFTLALQNHQKNNFRGAENLYNEVLKIKPETGKTIIWPAEWTHAHTGEILKSGKKYIITGWMHFPSDYKI